MKKSLTALILITFILAGVAAYFSIFGLTKLLVAPLLVIFFGILEVSKIAIVTLLNQSSKFFHWSFNSILILFTVILMFITSWGIFGYLSYAYTETSVRTNKNQGQIELLQKKDTLFKQEKMRYEDLIKTKTERIKTLSQLNLKQETRIDSMYNRGQYKNATKIENITAKTTDNILSLNKDIDDANNKIKSVDDSISKYDLEILNYSNNDVARDVGPLKYVAQFLNLGMDKVVKYLIFLLISVADPLSIAFVIAINILIKKGGKIESAPKKKYQFLKWFKRKNKPTETLIPETLINFTDYVYPESVVKEPIETTTEETIKETIIESEPIEIVNYSQEAIEEMSNETFKEIEKPEIEIQEETTTLEGYPIVEEHTQIEFIGENGPIIDEEVKEEPPFPEEELITENTQEILIEDLQFEEKIDKPLEVKLNTEEMEKLSEIKDNLEESLVLDNVLPEKTIKDENYMKNDFWDDEDIKKDEDEFWKDDNDLTKKKDEDFWNI